MTDFFIFQFSSPFPPFFLVSSFQSFIFSSNVSETGPLPYFLPDSTVVVANVIQLGRLLLWSPSSSMNSSCVIQALLEWFKMEARKNLIYLQLSESKKTHI
jgi:hypothetical protein